MMKKCVSPTVVVIIITFLFLSLVNKCCFGEIPDADLEYMYNHPNADDFHKNLIVKYVQMKRLMKCLQHFGSLRICQNNTTWFMWAQLLAKDIMNGKL